MKKFDVYKEKVEILKDHKNWTAAELKEAFVACYETRKEAEASLYNKGLDWCKITSNAAGKKVEK